MRRIIFLFVAGGVVRVTRLRIAALVGLAIMLLTACGSSSGDPAELDSERDRGQVRRGRLQALYAL
jgi:outer membrane biogenesis lipoprotein LolB